ncbi:TPA: hypothetical protein ACGOYK_001672 [Streptococcus suis]
MTKLIAQHGPAKGKKIDDGITDNNLNGVIFSLNDESLDSIEDYVSRSSVISRDNSFLDPQFYYSTYDSTVLKKLEDIPLFPSNVARRDWRRKNENVLNYLDFHAENSKKISNTLIAPGFHIEAIDWHFDYSVDIYNYCVENFESDSYALSLLLQTSFFARKENVKELIDEIEDQCEVRDYIYLTLCHEVNNDSNYEEIDANWLANILNTIYQLQKLGFKMIIGYSFMNSILFSMLGCDYVASGWFNTLRKFQKSRFDLTSSFGRRKKRYTSIPLLSNIMLDDMYGMLECEDISINDLLSSTQIDNYIESQDLDSVSFVDLEHQYWESLSILFDEFSSVENLPERIELMKEKIKDANTLYRVAIDFLEDEDKVAATRLKNSSKHLATWLSAIEIFKSIAAIV